MLTRDSQTESHSMQAPAHFVQQEIIAVNTMVSPNTPERSRLHNYPQATQEKHL